MIVCNIYHLSFRDIFWCVSISVVFMHTILTLNDVLNDYEWENKWNYTAV